MASRFFSRFAQPLLERRPTFAGGSELAHPALPDTVFEAPAPRYDRPGLEPRALDQSLIFALSNSTLPLGKLYDAVFLHTLVTHAEGQSALNSCLR